MIRLRPRKRAAEVIMRLEPLYGDLTTGLNFQSPFELLVATILSAQCTDERVNIVTPTLFARFPRAEDYVASDREEIESIIHSCGFYRNKAKSIQTAAAVIIGQFGGKVPDTMQALTTLPGVARKTANVVLWHAFGRNEGIAVDTHVQRLSRRLGLTKQQDPAKIEVELMAVVPSDTWGRLSDLLIWHGRRVCLARNPRCSACVLADICPSAGIGS
ncbi:MAG TPA: endonuclease III [Chloroflexota bacterium]